MRIASRITFDVNIDSDGVTLLFRKINSDANAANAFAIPLKEEPHVIAQLLKELVSGCIVSHQEELQRAIQSLGQGIGAAPATQARPVFDSTIGF